MGVKRKQVTVETKIEPPREYRWSNKQAISDLLSCPVCQDVFICPTRISCGHSFCRKCINDWFASCHRDECPLCRAHIMKEAMHRDLLAQSFLEREEVFCSVPYCNWMGPMGELDRHEAACKAEAEAKDKANSQKAKFSAFEERFKSLNSYIATSNT